MRTISSRAELVPSMRTVGDEIGRIESPACRPALGIGSDVSDSARRGEAETAAAPATGQAGHTRAGSRHDSTWRRGYHPEVRVRVKADTTEARAEIDSLGKGGAARPDSRAVYRRSHCRRPRHSRQGRLGWARASAEQIGSALPAIGRRRVPPQASRGSPRRVIPRPRSRAVTAAVGQAIAGAVVAGFGAGILGLAGIGAILSREAHQAVRQTSRLEPEWTWRGYRCVISSSVIKSILSTASGAGQ